MQGIVIQLWRTFIHAILLGNQRYIAHTSLFTSICEPRLLTLTIHTAENDNNLNSTTTKTNEVIKNIDMQTHSFGFNVILCLIRMEPFGTF